MPRFFGQDQEILLVYDPTISVFEGRAVSNFVPSSMSENTSLVIPSGTANFQVWINNSRPYISDPNPSFMAHWNTEYATSLTANPSIINSSFSSNWVQITTHPAVSVNGNVFTWDFPTRWIRLQGTGVTGSASSAIAYIWSTDCFNGRQ